MDGRGPSRYPARGLEAHAYVCVCVCVRACVCVCVCRGTWPRGTPVVSMVRTAAEIACDVVLACVLVYTDRSASRPFVIAADADSTRVRALRESQVVLVLVTVRSWEAGGRVRVHVGLC